MTEIGPFSRDGFVPAAIKEGGDLPLPAAGLWQVVEVYPNSGRAEHFRVVLLYRDPETKQVHRWGWMPGLERPHAIDFQREDPVDG